MSFQKKAKKMTPALKQYLSLKEKYSDAILLFRMGDFYEMFFDDAKKAAQILEIALTARSFGKGSPKVPMCGVPYHAAQSYIEKLVRAGYKVAICEQLEEPKPGKIVERDVIRVITPGTYFEDEKEERFLACVIGGPQTYAVAWCNVSTGDIYYTRADEEKLKDIFSKFPPKEVITDESTHGKLSGILKDAHFEIRESDFFNGKILEVGADEEERAAIYALKRFIEETQKDFLPTLKPPKLYQDSTFMRIDPHTQRNLELCEPLRGQNKRACLLGILDRTKTGMGRRFLKFSILHPLKDINLIKKRLNAVDELTSSFFISDELSRILSFIYDIERLTTKISSKIGTPRDMAALRRSLSELPQLKKLLLSCSSELLRSLGKNLDELSEIYQSLKRTLVENPPASPKEGGLIKEGVSEELDKLKKLRDNAESLLKKIEEDERKRTGIQSLKVGFNNVFGYYIEVSKANLHLIPKNYIRKQTLVNAERFITPELKELEEKILSAKERINAIEYEIFLNLRELIKKNALRLQKTAEIIGEVDFLLSLSEVAKERNYTKPKVTENFSIKIKEARHPVLEDILKEDFIPNDVNLNEQNFFVILTGPNMGGKSVFLRQTALITLMAQIGSFVPAQEAEISVVDRIFSRVGASDSLAEGISTFMMEMAETAVILKNATKRSLVILDEIGRGTSTYDGVSIAKAVCEYIVKNIGSKTLFATHYHELTELEGKLKAVVNYHVGVEEVDGRVIFTHKVQKGAAKKSYGIHVAELAGLPAELIKRAKEILSEFESSEPKTKCKIEDELRKIDISNTTPLQALLILSKLKELLDA